jgi:tetratricopeptide (TPR) repeat protein
MRSQEAILVLVIGCSALGVGIELAARNGFAGNLPAVERQVYKLMAKESDDLEAEWRTLSKKLGTLINLGLTDRSLELSRIAPNFDRLARKARDAKREGFLRYITAAYATYYGNYERALAEINKATAAEPNSRRYLGMKGQIHVGLGKKTGRDEEIKTGIRYIRQAQESLDSASDPSEKPEKYEFALAISISSLSKPRWDEVISHYERYISLGGDESSAFAWNNLSDAHRHAGDCRKAREAAEGALRVADFGAARRNKRAAEFCLEMEKLGMITKTTKTKR